MSTEFLSLILDFAVLTALSGTIYYALRLSKSLNNFRAHRNEMKTLIAELSKNINEAQGAIEGLKATSNIAADNLDDVLHESKKMADELKIINETSDSLANRLENLASKNRKLTQGLGTPDAYDFDDSDEDEEFFDDPKPANTDREPVDPPSFFIQDRDFDDGEDGDTALLSEAEKDLLEALQGKKSSGGGRG